MRAVENFTSVALMLVLVYLLLSNADDFSKVLRQSGSQFVDIIRTLQGRPVVGGR